MIDVPLQLVLALMDDESTKKVIALLAQIAKERSKTKQPGKPRKTKRGRPRKTKKQIIDTPPQKE